MIDRWAVRDLYLIYVNEHYDMKLELKLGHYVILKIFKQNFDTKLLRLH